MTSTLNTPVVDVTAEVVTIDIESHDFTNELINVMDAECGAHIHSGVVDKKPSVLAAKVIKAKHIIDPMAYEGAHATNTRGRLRSLLRYLKDDIEQAIRLKPRLVDDVTLMERLYWGSHKRLQAELRQLRAVGSHREDLLKCIENMGWSLTYRESQNKPFMCHEQFPMMRVYI